MSLVIPKELREVVARLPTWPVAVLKVLEMTKNPDCSLKEVGDTISRDPVFSLRLLKIVNSAFYNLKSEISSIHHASNILGIAKLRNLGLTISIISAKKQIPLPAGSLDFSRYMSHSTAVAVGVRRLASRMRELDEEMLFTAGLLHDIGKLVLISGMHDKWTATLRRASTEKTPTYMAEREELGFDHAAISSYIVKYWKLPRAIERIVALHHGPPDENDDSVTGAGRAVDALRLTDHVVHGMGITCDLEYSFLDDDDPVNKSLLELAGGVEAFENHISEELSDAEQAMSLI